MLGTVQGEFIILYYVYFTVFEKPQLAWGWLIWAVFFKIIAFMSYDTYKYSCVANCRTFFV